MSRRSWDARLEGGPFDGDRGVITTVPSMVWVSLCPKCKDTHWYSAPRDGGEPYRLFEKDTEARTVKYVQGNLGNSRRTTTREKEPIAA